MKAKYIGQEGIFAEYEIQEGVEPMNTVKLTQKQRSTLDLYLRITTQHRKEEQAACERLGSELDEAGALKYPNIAANTIWWAETESVLQEVLVALERAETEEETK